METFTHSGALSISTVPRAVTALVVVLIRAGLGGHTSTISDPTLSLAGAILGQILTLLPQSQHPYGPIPITRRGFSGMPLTNMVMLHRS